LNILCVGLLTLDITQTVTALPGPNEKTVALSTSVDFGGPAANAAASASILGSDVTLASLASKNAVSALALAQFKSYGGDFISLVHTLDEANTYESGTDVPIATIMVTKNTGERAVVSGYPSVPKDYIFPGKIPDFDVLLLDGHNLIAAKQTAKVANERGALVVLDGGSWKVGLEELLPLVDIAILSADFRAPEGYKIPCKYVAISNGGDPITVLSPTPATVPVPKSKIVDTLGAGDVLHGAFAHFIVGKEITFDAFIDALSNAAAIASASCEHSGALGWKADYYIKDQKYLREDEDE